MDGQEWTDAIRYRITSGQVNVWAERSGSTTDGVRIRPVWHARCRT